LTDDLVPVGRVGKAHGLDGSFFVDGPSRAVGRFAKGATLWVGGEPARVETSKQARGRPVIRLDRRVNRGATLQVPRDSLEPTDEGQYYVFELVGLQVEDEGARQLGTVTDVVPGVANDVLELDTGLHLPLVEACIRQVDLEAGQILVTRGFAAPG